MNASLEYLTDTISSISVELAVLGLTFFCIGMISVLVWNRRTNHKRLRSITREFEHSRDAVMVFKRERLEWMNERAKQLCPNVFLKSNLMDVTWKFSGTIDQHARFYNKLYSVHMLTPVEETYVTEESVINVTEDRKQFRPVETNNYKLLNDQMEVFEKVLSENSYLLMAGGITVFANRNNCDLDVFPKFEQLAEAFLRIGHYLLKDRRNAHIDFLFDHKNKHCFIQMNLKNIKASNFAFGEEFFLKGFGSETLDYQLNRLEVLFESLGGSMQLIENGKDLVLVGKVRSLPELVRGDATF